MPIPPPERYAPSTLTKKQQQEQLAVCYGVNMSPVDTQIPLSASEIERMRHIIAQHDSETKKATIHDLNNPPKEPYKFQKFPMMVYDLEHSHPAQDVKQPKVNGMGTEVVHIPAKVVSQVVRSEEQLRAALAGGWSEEAPVFTEEREEPLKVAYASEAGQIDAVIEANRPKRHYNRKEG